VLAESLGCGEDLLSVTPKGAPRGATFDTFLIFLGITLNMGVNAEMRVTPLTSRSKPLENSSVHYLITHDLLSIEINSLANPRLVMIPAQSIVELKGTSSVPGFAELIWEHRTHMIFEADLARLNACGKGVKSRGHAREAQSQERGGGTTRNHRRNMECGSRL
jgi:hypothetical protein